MQNNRETTGYWPKEPDALTAAAGRHKSLFENDSVRVIDAVIPPGEITALHTHRWPASLYILSWSGFIRYGAQGNILVDSRNSATPPSPRTALWSEPLALHQLKNTGNENLHVISVEMIT